MKTYEAYAGKGRATPGNGHRRDADEIEHDLAEIRAEIGNTLAAIQQRFSPGELLSQIVGGARGVGRDVGRGSVDFLSNLGQTVRDNPVPAALVGIGLAYLLLSGGGRPGAREDRGRAGRRRAVRAESEERTERPATGLLDARQERGEDGGETPARIAEAAGGAREATRRGAERLRSATAELSDRARSGALRARARATGVVHDQPLVIGALGLAVGAALGAAVPTTRRERAALGPAADAVKGRIGAPLREAIEPSAREAEAAPREAGAPAPRDALPDREAPRRASPPVGVPVTKTFETFETFRPERPLGAPEAQPAGEPRPGPPPEAVVPRAPYPPAPDYDPNRRK
jgi:hypothetical protein